MGQPRGESEKTTTSLISSEGARIAKAWADQGWPAEPDESGQGITAPFNAPSQLSEATVSHIKRSLTRIGSIVPGFN
jgi:hypothetical protein